MKIKRNIVLGVASCMLLGNISVANAIYDPDMDYSNLDPNQPRIMLLKEEPLNSKPQDSVGGFHFVLVINNKGINPENTKVYQNENGFIMVPLRIIGEKLGYEVKWNGIDKPIEIMKGAQYTSIKPGEDYYFYGKMAPITLGIAPEIKDSVTYVPLQFLNDILKVDAWMDETGVITIKHEEKVLSYDITKEMMKNEEKNLQIFYPQITGYKGELLMDYMNQSLKRITDIYTKEDSYSDIHIDYQIKKMDNDIISILFEGTGKLQGIRDINIKHSVNLDLKSSNEINYNNLVINDEEVLNLLEKKALEQGLETFEAEGIKLYFEDENVVFYYMIPDDSEKVFTEIYVPKNELEGLINTEFGEKPMS